MEKSTATSRLHAPALRPWLILLVAALSVLPVSAFSAGRKPEPSGIYDLLFGAPGTGRVDLTGNPLLPNPNIEGFRFKTGWAKIQPTSADEYKWDQIDSAIAIAAANGKKLCISISAGFSCPSWVYTTAPVVYKYDMLEKDSTGKSVGSQPLPWDTAYQDKWLKFLAAFAARYESNPACSYVVMGGFMETFNMVVAGTQADADGMEALAKNPPPGYPGLVTQYADFSSAYTPAAQKVIASYATDFPTTPLLLTMTRVLPNDIGLTLQNTVVAWALSAYPGLVGTMVSALYASPPPHDPPPDPPITFPKGFQMVCVAIEDPSRLYLDPDPVPMPPAPTPLQDALERGVTAGAKFIEVYQQDLTPPESQPVLAVEMAKLKANVPPNPPPAAPTNLRIAQ